MQEYPMSAKERITICKEKLLCI